MNILRNINIAKAVSVAMIALMASCASKKTVVGIPAQPEKKTETTSQKGASSAETSQLSFVQKVFDGHVYAKNITGNITFNLQSQGKDITMPGALRMRKDEMIRIQIFIPLLGSEVGRLEFTPEGVLFVDRIHKKYGQAGYDQVDFLKQNGINFYSLQALFWNQLFVPGAKTLSAQDLKAFAADIASGSNNATLRLKGGNIAYSWKADKATGRIVSASATYKSAAHGTSSLDWKYADFRPVGVKMFPAEQSFTFTTTATKTRQTATVSLSMGSVKTDSNWDTKTTLSSKYTKIDTSDLLKNIINMQ